MKNVEEILKQMTIEEKASLMSGANFWNTKAIDRLGIPSIMMTDGPHGLRKQGGNADHLGISQSVPATCFPSGSALASSWDRDMINNVGKLIGEEALVEDVAIVLGPGCNIKRSPLCGRNFEYLSEDPYLSSQMAKSHINGIQSNGIGTSIKHYLANNQETLRMTINSVVDERSLNELYLASFEEAIKEAKPWTVMCSYNKLNGTYMSENKTYLSDVLKEKWGYEGLVVTDWGATNNRVEGLLAGLDLEMPSSNGVNDKKIVDAIKDGKVSEECLDEAVRRVLNITFKAEETLKNKTQTTYDSEFHHQKAREVASECMVLLKNEQNILPLNKKDKILIVGEFAEKPRYQGGGSSHINPTKIDNILEILKYSSKDISYAKGFEIKVDNDIEELLQEAVAMAKENDKVVLCVGLPDSYESEGYDRTHMNLPQNQLNLINKIYESNKNIVVVLSCGSPIVMPWISKVKGLLLAYLAGQGGASAICDLIYGKISPSGKLAETFPIKIEDTPSFLSFPGDKNEVVYTEGIFVGYKYYEKKKLETLFPFGFGLSYSSFEYSDIKLDKTSMNDTEILAVSVKIKNTGNIKAKEIVQLYVGSKDSNIIMPVKQLKGFEKVSLEPGEQKTIEFLLTKRDFAYYCVVDKEWFVELGNYEIFICKSSDNVCQSATIHITPTTKPKFEITLNTTISELLNNEKTNHIAKQMLETMQQQMGGKADDNVLSDGDDDFIQKLIAQITLRALILFSGGSITEEMILSWNNL